MKNLFLGVALAAFINGCTFAEINIVQRAVIEDGQGITHQSADKALREESNKMELIVPIK